MPKSHKRSPPKVGKVTEVAGQGQRAKVATGIDIGTIEPETIAATAASRDVGGR